MQKILIVEDDDGVASLVRKIVEEEGFITEIASDADGGWSALIAHDPDAAIVDIWLYGRETGWDLLEKIRANEHFHDLPVVVLTGVTGPEATERAQALGCEYVSKPFSPAILIDRLQRLIRAAGRSPAMREMPVVLLAGFYRIEGKIHIPAELVRFSDAWEALVRDPRSYLPVTEAKVTTIDGSQVSFAADLLEVRKAEVTAALPLG